MKRNTKLSLLLLTTSLTLAATSSQSLAAVLYTFDNPTAAGGPPAFDFTLGTKFTVGSTDVQVSALGFYDAENNGLLVDHTLRLYNAGGTQLTSVSAGQGTTGTVTNVSPDNSPTTYPGAFRFYSLGVPITLAANTTYIVAADMPIGQDAFYNSGEGTTLLSSDFGSYNAIFSFGLNTFPNDQQAPSAYVGPNLQYTVVPEPSSKAFLALGLGTLFIRRARYRA